MLFDRRLNQRAGEVRVEDLRNGCARRARGDEFLDQVGMIGLRRREQRGEEVQAMLECGMMRLFGAELKARLTEVAGELNQVEFFLIVALVVVVVVIFDLERARIDRGQVSGRRVRLCG